MEVTGKYHENTPTKAGNRAILEEHMGEGGG